MTQTRSSLRWVYLAVGVAAMLFAGILYAWSILKAPFTAEFGWGPAELALNFTIAMCFFCIGGLLGAEAAKRFGHKLAILAAGVLAALGFVLTGALSGESVAMLYLTYGVLAGTGIGMAYNVVISTVSAWFPDKKGLCSGCLMMGFGASALVLGNAASAMMGTLGWRSVYTCLGIAIGVVMAVAALALKKPDAAPAAAKQTASARDYTPAQMLRRPSFWMAFVCLAFLAAVGSSVISFARDLALSVGAAEALAVTLVGVLSVCNGLGRILTGALFDALGRRFTMLCGNILTICAAGVTLVAVHLGSLPLCILGLCLTGMSYGSCPTITAAFTSAFFGTKHYSTNMALMTFNVMGGSLIATASSRLLEATGGYSAPFAMLLAMTLAALVLNLFLKKP